MSETKEINSPIDEAVERLDNETLEPTLKKTSRNKEAF